MAGLACIVSGCLTISIYPFYAEKDVVFEPGLIGHWTKPTDAKEKWTFERKGEQGYELTYDDGKTSHTMDAHLFKIKDQLFLDLFNPKVPEDLTPPAVPTHMLLRVFQTKPTLRMAGMDYDWLSKVLEKSPDAIRHHLLVSDDKDKDGQIVLTADTAELQKFILKHLKTEEAWKDPFELQQQ